MNKLIVGIVIVVLAMVAASQIQGNPGILGPVVWIAYFIGLALVWFGILSKLTWVQWMKWTAAVVLAALTMWAFVYFQLVQGI